jgi:hypothetical protein
MSNVVTGDFPVCSKLHTFHKVILRLFGDESGKAASQEGYTTEALRHRGSRIKRQNRNLQDSQFLPALRGLPSQCLGASAVNFIFSGVFGRSTSQEGFTTEAQRITERRTERKTGDGLSLC